MSAAWEQPGTIAWHITHRCSPSHQPKQSRHPVGVTLNAAPQPPTPFSVARSAAAVRLCRIECREQASKQQRMLILRTP